jgi:hypothetical protein
LIHLTSLSSSSALSSAKTSLRKSLFIIYSGGTYNCTEQWWLSCNTFTYCFLWSNGWNLPWNWSDRRVLEACGAVSSYPLAVDVTVVESS